ncbi:MAG: ATP-binding protein [Methylococcales bacterium]
MNTKLLLAMLLPFSALGLQWLLWPWIKPFVWFLFFPTVFFSAQLGGLKGGLISTVISAVIVWFVFIPPQFVWTIYKSANFYSVGMFMIMGYLISDAQQRLQLARQRTETALSEARNANAKVTELYQQTLELDQLKSQFFANVSHELRTPLTLIISPLARRLTSAELSASERSETEMLLRNAKLLNRHVDDLLDAAKLESGHVELTYTRVDIGALVRGLACQFDSLAQEKLIQYHYHAIPTLQAEVDEEKLQRILLNLLSNAFKFTPNGGVIEVRLSAQAGQAIIDVQDNGPGIPVEFRTTVFERFRQVQGDAQRRFGGTGLGLAIAKEFAEQMAGAVYLTEPPGGGALFSLQLPLQAPKQHTIVDAAPEFQAPIDLQILDELRHRSPPLPALPNTPAEQYAPLILVVEDNLDMSAFITDSLRPYYRVVCAADGEQGLQQALTLKPDLIISDIMMPRLSGDQMVAALRSQVNPFDAPIIMLSAKADDDLRVHLLQQGVQSYLTKPFLVEELLAGVGNLISSSKRNSDKLDETEARFQATFEQAAVGIALLAPDGQWLRVNRKLCEIVGYSQHELMGLTFQHITHADDLDTDLNQVRRMLAGEIQTYALEKRYIRKNSELIWINLTVALARKPDGSPDYFISVVENIQARKQAEQALKASELALKTAQRLANIGSWHWDVVTDTHTWSAEVYNIYGRDPALAPADYQEAATYFTPKSWAKLATAVEKCLKEQLSYECDAEVVRPDGEHRWVVARGQAGCAADGGLVDLYGTVQDITERKQAEENLRKSQAQLKIFIKHAPISTAMLDREMNYLSTSGRWLQEFSTGYSELLGRNHYQVHPDIPAEWKIIHQQALAGATLKNDDDLWIRKDGSKHWLRWAVLPWTNENGEIGGIIISTEDITDRKLAEQEVLRLNANLEQRIAERTAELSIANHELDSFAYAVSHDLRAPLRAMSGFSQALSEDYGEQLQGEAKTYLQQISLASEKMSALIDGLLALSRSVRGALRCDDIDISALSERLLRELLQHEPNRQVSFKVQPGLNVHGDMCMIEIVMTNLLHNAWKYTLNTPGAHIRVYAEQRHDSRYICVADNGAGFDCAYANRLFQPFQRLHRQEEFPGIGIGLATVQRIVTRHGGRIEATSEPGKGAIFSFTLTDTPAELASGKLRTDDK